MATELWLALQFPHLALDLLCRGQRPRGRAPMAVSATVARRPSIVDCNPVAARAGVRPGLPVAAAQALVADLQVHPCEPAAEAAALQRLAAFAYRYSSRVTVLAAHCTLLLEIGASRRLFGPAEALTQRLVLELQRLGYHARAGTAASPEAAQLAARHGRHLDPGRPIGPQVCELPLTSLRLDSAQGPTLENMGFRTVGEVMRLPRKALARRLGTEFVDYLDRLTGARPDPQTSWRPPERFESALDLPTGLHNVQALLFPLRRLFSELCGVLRALDRAVQEVSIHLRLAHDETSIRMGLQQPSRCEEHLQRLVREHLERLRVRAPVRRITLCAPTLLPYAARQGALWRGGEDRPVSIDSLLDRLRARLGRDGVSALAGIEDHRPERSWAAREPGTHAACTPRPYRPAWLLEHAQRCRIEDFRFICGPERIETGWWDGQDCRRDYFVVRDRAGSLLWVFREYKPRRGWYLHGLFA
ncbi:MAG: hypothetical protein GTN86_11595 [Xanthomonadales bacterium]|nr:hypothetical protein [Xanthomonadales bacterium]NIN58653.1 hypothetical protein [Xanthomonadales bacterium]NIN73948.1 hypothetical protein [Xanthomonadales bacterium]NIO14580.1 hypothetical protein [Xanthomonadales bacterium]NIP11046.1 hypothetical protein [Xanthomonadales bacterium]